MKTAIQLIIAGLLTGAVHAEFRTWTREDGKTAELELTAVTGEAAAKTGKFKMRNGRTINLPASSLSTADAQLLDEWQPTAAAETGSASSASIFDKDFERNLEKLSGKSLKPIKDATKPSKYYLFYYTASWCGPCHKFTPSLVDFYKKNKDARFELVLITSDSDEGAMESYAAEFKMPWPQLKLSKVSGFKKDHPYPGTGIPNLVLTDLDGKLIKGSYEGTTYHGPTVVMDHLATLLKK